MFEEKILNYIEDNKEEYINFLQKLIQTDSYNPPGNEKNVAIIIQNYLEQAKIPCEVYPFGDNRANLLAYLNEDFDSKTLLYNGHMDVVPPGELSEWKYPPLSGQIKRKKMFGRGTADMKGGLVAMIIALKIINKLFPNLKGNLILSAVADEETGGDFGAAWSIKNLLKDKKIDFAIVGESTGLDPLPKGVVIGEKGHLQLKIITNGVSCHSSIPFQGINAIEIMNNILTNINKLDNFLPKIEAPLSYEKIYDLMGDSFKSKEIFDKIFSEQQLLQDFVKALTEFTINVTKINAGIKENVIPDKCEAILDCRLLPNQPIDTVLQALKKLISSLGYIVKDKDTEKIPESYVELEIFHRAEGSYWQEWEESKLIKILFSLSEKVYGKRPYYGIFPAGSDARHFRSLGACEATVIYGPGNGKKAHSADENIEISDFLNAIKIYSLFAYYFLSDKEL